MTGIRGGLLVTAVLFWAACLLGITSAPERARGAEGAVSPQPAPAAAAPAPPQSDPVQPTPPSSKPVSPALAEKLLREFKRAQANQLGALWHQHELELSEARQSQRVRLREWDERMREEREKYFAEHTDGVTRKTFLNQLRDKRKVFEAELESELDGRRKAYEERVKRLKEDHQIRLAEFEKHLKEGRRPPESLWPGAY